MTEVAVPSKGQSYTLATGTKKCAMLQNGVRRNTQLCQSTGVIR